MNQYAIYLRKSRADLEAEALGEGETLARHYSILMNLAAKHEILPDQLTIYKEIVSGESISERPQMQALLADVYSRKYTGVLVVEIERLARGNTKDQGEIAEAFQFSNTKIITPVKIYDPNNEFDQEYFEFGLFMSRREYKTIKRRMEAGRSESVAEGNYCGSLRPYGYNIERINKKERILVPNETEAPYVKMIFDWFTEDNLSSGEIARKLTAMSVPTLTGNKEWNRGTIKDILKNIHYTGMVRWNRRRCTKEYDPQTNSLFKHKRRLTPDDYKVYKGKHQPLISFEQFEKAQNLFVGQVPVKAQETLVNPLSGLLFCKKCGKSLYYNSFIAQNAEGRFMHRSSQFCKLKSCAESTLFEALVISLQAYLDDFEIKLKNQNADQEQSADNELLQSLQNNLSKQEAKRIKLFDAFEDGIYTNNEFIERKNILNESIEGLKNQIQALKDQTPKQINYSVKIITLHQAIEMLPNPKIDAKTKNSFLKSFIDRIEYDAEDLGRNKGTKPILDIYLK